MINSIEFPEFHSDNKLLEKIKALESKNGKLKNWIFILGSVLLITIIIAIAPGKTPEEKQADKV